MAKRPELLAGERKEGETDRAVQACNDYLRMGPGRSLSRLLKKYTKTNQKQPATESEGTLKGWSADYEWQLRASAHDAALEEIRNAKRRKEFDAGLALDYERIRKLKSLASLLEKDLTVRLWLDDVKSIGSGESAERIDLIRFNSALIEQYRGVLDDLAKEVGGRKQKSEVLNIDLSKLSDEQLSRISAGEDPMKVVLSAYAVAD